MAVSKFAAVASGVAVAAVISAGALAYTALPSRSAPQQAAEAAAPLVRTGATDSERTPAQSRRPEAGVNVEAPSTSVNVDREHGKVRVEAPYTSVHVDPDKGRVRVRAPYVNLDIRW